MKTIEEVMELLRDRVTYQLSIEPEDIPVRGNAIASGDDAYDKKVEDEIIRRVDNGDDWAWCTVEVDAIFFPKGGQAARITGRTSLGGCSYKDEEDFKQEGGYYPQMQDDALRELATTIVGYAATLQLLGFEVVSGRTDGSAVATPAG